MTVRRWYHACDGCWHSWGSREYLPAAGCPFCRADAHWIATFKYPEHAETHADRERLKAQAC